MVTSKPNVWAEVDEQGRLVLPPEMAERFGLTPGARVRLEDDTNHVRLHRPVTHLAKVYIEPTDHCNIDCVTCIRNVWDEPMGRMKAATFARILEGAQSIAPRPTLFFMGIGEPLLHIRTVEWIAQAKAIGARAELLTNGTLLTEKKSRELIDAGLDVLWVSLDGATPESYGDVRLGAHLPAVLENLTRFSQMRRFSYHPRPEIGIAFVAMKRNIKDLPELLAMGRRFRAAYFKVSNVLAYTDDLRGDMLYENVMSSITYMPSPWLSRLSIPKMDIDDVTQETLFRALRSGYNVTFAGNNLGGTNDVCNFIESGSISVAWDGGVAPCLPLLHSHTHHIGKHKRFARRHLIGSVDERSLIDLWNDPDYVTYRERVHSFAFAPCTFCGGCELLDGNEEDCLGNTFPACGGCLWAQGVIQCP